MDPEPDVAAALEEVRAALERDLPELFGHGDARVRVVDVEGHRVVAEGADGRFVVRWPPGEGMVQAEGRLGAHGRIAFEFLLASANPAEFFEGYRPVSPVRRDLVFEALAGYLDETLGGNKYYPDLVTVVRGPAMLVFGDDEYAIVAEDGHHRGHGILHWKVKRLVAYALTDADEALT